MQSLTLNHRMLYHEITYHDISQHNILRHLSYYTTQGTTPSISQNAPGVYHLRNICVNKTPNISYGEMFYGYVLQRHDIQHVRYLRIFSEGDDHILRIHSAENLCHMMCRSSGGPCCLQWRQPGAEQYISSVDSLGPSSETPDPRLQ